MARHLKYAHARPIKKSKCRWPYQASKSGANCQAPDPCPLNKVEEHPWRASDGRICSTTEREIQAEALTGETKGERGRAARAWGSFKVERRFLEWEGRWVAEEGEGTLLVMWWEDGRDQRERKFSQWDIKETWSAFDQGWSSQGLTCPWENKLRHDWNICFGARIILKPAQGLKSLFSWFI